jgi:acetoin utilization deacetylase AcuC-like enzyme
MKIFYSDAHQQHNPPYEVTDGGKQIPYYESPERMNRILAALGRTDWAELLPPQDFGLDPIRAVHSDEYVDFLQTAFARWMQEGGEHGLQFIGPVLLPATFPPRRSNHRPTSVVGQAGYHVFDLGAPIVQGTYEAAYASAQCAISAAQAVIINGEQAVFALCRPPGHHAGRDYAGGYCFINNASVAAAQLRARGKVAILDMDYHGGNGTQDIFYESADVLTISIHADPDRMYPGFLGFANETGAGAGLGFHRNFPLPPDVKDDDYLRVLDEAIGLVRQFQPQTLVVSAGMDIYEGDPLGDFDITTDGFRRIGDRIAALTLPTAIIMEGGYNTDALGENTVALVGAFVR